jgi:hypothetical protein
MSTTTGIAHLLSQATICCEEEVAGKSKTNSSGCCDDEIEGIRFVDYVDESQLHDVMSLVGRDLSEPYSSESFQLQMLFSSNI